MTLLPHNNGYKEGVPPLCSPPPWPAGGEMRGETETQGEKKFWKYLWNGISVRSKGKQKYYFMKRKLAWAAVANTWLDAG